MVAPEVVYERVETCVMKVLVIVLAGLFIYAPAFHGDWLWDDDQEIAANAVLTAPNGLVRIWTGAVGTDYFPLKSTVQWFYFRAVGTSQTGWHLLSISLHLLSALLVWKVLAKLGVRQAWLGGLLFVIHPVLVESVAWVSELKNTLSLPFLLLAMLTWMNFDERGRARDYFLTLLFFVAALLTKTSVVMFPFVLLLYSWWRSEQKERVEAEFPPGFFQTLVRDLGRLLPLPVWRGVVASLPFFLVALAAGGLTIYFQHSRAIGFEAIPVGDMVSRTATAGVSIWFYLYKTVLPFGLLPIYPRWEVDPPPFWMFLSWPFLGAFVFWLWTKRKTWGSHALLGLGFFLINLFPIIGFIKMSYMRITWVADHFIYLPSLGIIGLAAAFAGALYDRSSRQNQLILVGVGLAFFSVLTFSSHRYAGIFSGEQAMWTHTLKGNPNAWQAHSRLGKVMFDAGNNDAAFYHIGESVRIRPDLGETQNNYGAMLEKKGDLKGAVERLRAAVRLSPEMGIYKVNLGSLLVRMGRYAEAMEVYQVLVHGDPEDAAALCNLGVAQYFIGRNDEAIINFQKALAIHPDLKDAKENLAQALKKRAGGTVVPVPPAAAPSQGPGIIGSGE